MFAIRFTRHQKELEIRAAGRTANAGR